MNPVNVFLLVIAAIFLVGIAAEWVFRRTGIPDVLWLLAVGIAVGPLTGLAHRNHLVAVAPFFGAVTIVIVLFEGGMALRLTDLGRASGRAGSLALAGFLLSAATVGAASMGAASWGLLPDDWTWMHAATLGAILGGSSSVVVMPALRTAHAGPAVSTLLGLESALTDVLCIVGTGVCVEVLTGGGATASAESVSVALLRTLGVGVLVGAAAGLLSLWVLRRVSRLAQAFPIVLAFLLVLYVVADGLDGSAPLAILTAAVIVGNAPSVSRLVGMTRPAELGRALRGMHGQATFIVKTFFFTFMGAMLAPPWALIGLGAALAVCLLAARIPSVIATTAGMGLDAPSRRMAFVCIPRGMAAGVLSGLPAAEGVAAMQDVPIVVFATVAATIVIFAAGFAYARRGASPTGGPEPVAAGTPTPA